MIDPAAVLDARRGRIDVGDGATIAPFAVIFGPVRIGPGARIGAHAVVGASPSKRGASACGAIVLGARVTVGAHAVVEAGSAIGGASIGDDAMVLPHAYVGHDARIGARVVVAAHAALGGFVFVDDDATVGAGAVVHQRSTIGAFALVGMRTVVARDVPPFAIARGMPARIARTNTLALRRAGFSDDAIDACARWLELRDAPARALCDVRAQRAIDLFFERQTRAVAGPAPIATGRTRGRSSNIAPRDRSRS